MNLKELYQEIILDHGKNPRNKGNAMDLIEMQKLITLCVVIRFIFMQN